MQPFVAKLVMKKNKHENLENTKHGNVARPFLSPGVHVPYQGGTFLMSAVARMDVIATHCRMQCLVTRIIRNNVPEKPILVSVGFGHIRARKQASRSRSQPGSDKLNKSHCKRIESGNRTTTSSSVRHAYERTIEIN